MADKTNKDIAQQFKLLGDLMELHGENKFKIRSYQSAYQKLRKMDVPISDWDVQQLMELEGVGKAIAEKIYRYTHDNEFPQLEKYVDQTPAGVIDMLGIRGLGPKKIRQLWKELEVESPGELLQACRENRLVHLKGMGEKTQTKIEKQLAFFLQAQEWIRIDQARTLYLNLTEKWPADCRVEPTGDLRRWMPTMKGIELISEPHEALTEKSYWEEFPEISEADFTDESLTFKFESIPVRVIWADASDWETIWLKTTGGSGVDVDIDKPIESETAYFESQDLPFIPAELRDHPDVKDWTAKHKTDELIELEDIRGMVHLHTDWSDGGGTLTQMVEAGRDKGYTYITITDHSAAAFYANGLNADRLRRQREAIDALQVDDIRIFAGCEVDIMPSGEMDLDSDILSELDIVIASVHSQLQMNEEKAMDRLLQAIAHPHVHMLGHPTGRLILSRPGYPIDHKTIIDACAEHQVAIEINANPLRLDIDWTWIPYAMEQGVYISINPDAHSISNMDLMPYGLAMGRKGGLVKSMCLNAQSPDEFYRLLHRKDKA